MKIKCIINEKSQPLRELDIFSRQVKESNAEAEIAHCQVQVINLQALDVITVHARHIQGHQIIILPEKMSVQKLIFCSSV
jgi:hypothetical protein